MEVRKARHVPVEVEYVELTASNGPEVADWCGGEWVFGALLVPTIIGQVRPAPDASWLIVKGTQGEYYPVRADVFGLVYEPADAPSAQRALDTITRGGQQ